MARRTTHLTLGFMTSREPTRTVLHVAEGQAKKGRAQAGTAAAGPRAGGRDHAHHSAPHSKAVNQHNPFHYRST